MNVVLTLPQLRLLAGHSRPGTLRNCSSDTHPAIRFNTRSSICLQLVPAQIAPNTRPACHHSTGSHPQSSVHHLANCSVPTTFSFFEHVPRHGHQVARVKPWKLLVTLMTMMIHHAQQVQTLCDVETTGGTGTVVCSANLPFSCLVPHEKLGVRFFHALP